MPIYRCFGTNAGLEQVELTGDAQEENVLSGKTFYNDSTEKKTGTMPNNTSIEKILDVQYTSNQSYTIPKGYHDGTGKVKIEPEIVVASELPNKQYIRPANGKVLAQVEVPAYPTFEGTATTNEVMEGKTFYNNNNELKTGTAKTVGEIDVELRAGEEYVLPLSCFCAGGSIFAMNLDEQTRPKNGTQAIDNEHVIDGYSGWVNGELVNGSANAATFSYVERNNVPTPLRIVSGYSAWANGVKIDGAMPNRGAIDITLDTTNTEAEILAGFHNGDGIVKIVPEDQKTVTPSASAQTIAPATGKVLSTVKVNAVATEQRTGVNAVSPSTSDQTILPSNGKFLSRVDVKGVELTGDAWTGAVKEGVTFYSNSLEKKTGTAKTVGEIDVELSAGEEYVLPTSCFCAGGSIFAKGLAEQTRTNQGNKAVESWTLLSGYQGWINGERVTGFMQNREDWHKNGASGEKVIIPEGYHDGTGYVQCPSVGSGEMTAETLWTNSSPASSDGFAAQTVTLTKSFTNNGYKYIGIEYRSSVSYGNVAEMLISVDQFKKSGTTYYPDICLGAKVAGSSGRRCRYAEYVSSTQISFTTGYKMGAADQSKNWCIPTKIKGYK